MMTTPEKRTAHRRAHHTHSNTQTRIPPASAADGAIVGTQLSHGHTLLEDGGSDEHPAALLLWFLLGGLTPADDQMNRGDCWLFALGGVLEDSYHRFGVANGWLAPGQYVRLSKQALGIAVMEACRVRPSALCPASLGADGQLVWGGPAHAAR